MEADPSDDELRAFAASLLGELAEPLREPEVLDETVRERRELWLMLYRVSQGFDLPDSP